MASAKYSIHIHGNLILARTTGEWDLSTDIAYLAEASSAMSAQKGRSFYIIVDMRGWRVTDEVKYATVKDNLVLDRRGQKGECWLMDSTHQANYLLPYFSNFRFTLDRFTRVDHLKQWVKKHNDIDFDTTLANWLDKKP